MTAMGTLLIIFGIITIGPMLLCCISAILRLRRERNNYFESRLPTFKNPPPAPKKLFKMKTVKKVPLELGHCSKPLIIGCVYGQTISGTLFKQKIINYQGSFQGIDFYLVENTETGYRHAIEGSSLHTL